MWQLRITFFLTSWYFWLFKNGWTHQLRCKCITWKFTCLHAHSANSVTICVQKTEWKLNQIWVFSQWWQFFTFTLKNLPITARYFSVFFLWKLRSGLHEIVYASAMTITSLHENKQKFVKKSSAKRASFSQAHTLHANRKPTL